MPVVLLFMGVVAFATGISALVMHNSVSKSTSSSNILSEIGESKENLDKEIKTKLFLGTVSIIIYIAEREQMKKQQEEMLQSIGGGVAASTELSTAATIKVAKHAIAELQTEQGQEIGATTSQTTEVSGSVAISNDGPIIPPLIPPDIGEIGTPPLIPPDIGPTSPPSLVPPNIGPVGTPPLIPPDIGPVSPPPLIPPAVKELDDYILRSNGNKVAIKDKPNQEHHFITNKSKKYTQQFEQITKKYKLDLDDAWNKKLMPHQGRHPYAYHDYMLEQLKKFDRIAKGDVDKFLKLYEQLKKKVMDNPDMLTKDYWNKK